MNDLFSRSSWRKSSNDKESLRMNSEGVSSTPSDMRVDIPTEQVIRPDEDLSSFFKREQRIRSEISNMHRAINKLRTMNEEGKSLITGSSIKTHAIRMEEEMKGVKLIAKSIESMLSELIKDNKLSSRRGGCGKGTATYNTRQNVTEDLCKKVEDRGNDLNELVEKINADERETAKRRYMTITGESPDEKTLEKLSTAADRERFLQAAVQGQGRDELKQFLREMEERSEGVQGIVKELLSLQEMFVDMAKMVEVQGEYLEEIDIKVENTATTIAKGTTFLEKARRLQLSTRKSLCCAFLLILVIIGVILIVLKIANII